MSASTPTASPGATPGTAARVPHRALITGCAMIATMMNVLDSTIANVALP